MERGRFSKTVAHMEGTGIPIDVPKYDEVIRKRKLIIATLIEPIDKIFKVFSGTTSKCALPHVSNVNILTIGEEPRAGARC